MQLSLRTLVSRAFDAADWVIIRTLSGAQVASKKFWVSDNSEDGIMRACLETQKLEQLEARMDEIAEDFDWILWMIVRPGLAMDTNCSD